MAAIRPAVTRMSPFSITSVPFMVSSRAPRNSVLPVGSARGTLNAIATCSGLFESTGNRYATLV